MSETGESFHHIAVIGMVCRLPGAADVQQFWRNLKGGVESISSLTDEELDKAGVERAERDNPNYVRSAGGWLDGIDLFDASFFGMSPREAEITSTDPAAFRRPSRETAPAAFQRS